MQFVMVRTQVLTAFNTKSDAITHFCEVHDDDLSKS